MEESGTTIRDEKPDPPVEHPQSWLCDDDDRPVLEFVHEYPNMPFRVKVGARYYERFGQNSQGEWLYRRVK